MRETTDERSQRALLTMAGADPAFRDFSAALPADLDRGADLPPQLLRDVVAVLSDDPETGALLDACQNAPPEQGAPTFTLLPEAGLLVAALFLLRTHFKIARDASGKWEFVVEHKPGDNELVGKVLSAIAKLLGGPSGD